MITAGWDGTLRLWPSGRVIADQLGPVYQIALDTTGTRVATAGWDFAVRLFELPSGDPLGAQARDEPPVPSGMSFSPDSASLAVAYRTGEVHVFDPATGARRTTLHGHIDAALLAVFSPDSAKLATSGFDHSVRIWSVPDGAHVATLEAIPMSCAPPCSRPTVRCSHRRAATPRCGSGTCATSPRHRRSSAVTRMRFAA